MEASGVSARRAMRDTVVRVVLYSSPNFPCYSRNQPKLERRQDGKELEP